VSVVKRPMEAVLAPDSNDTIICPILDFNGDEKERVVRIAALFPVFTSSRQP
jgi:hypothetical protein